MIVLLYWYTRDNNVSQYYILYSKKDMKQFSIQPIEALNYYKFKNKRSTIERYQLEYLI